VRGVRGNGGREVVKKKEGKKGRKEEKRSHG